MAKRQKGSGADAPRLKDIARLCGVSTATVSRALRDPHRHSVALTEKIRKATETLGYDPQVFHGARKLSMRRHGKSVLNQLVAAILPEHFQNSPYFMTVLHGALDVFSEAGFGVVVVKDSVTTAPSCLVRGEVDGAITFCQDNALFSSLVRNTAFPMGRVIQILEPLSEKAQNLPRILPDYEAGTRLGVEKLIALGHRQFAFLHRSDLPPREGGKSALQYAGIMQALKAAKLNPQQYFHPVPVPLRAWELAHLTMLEAERVREWDRMLDEPSPLVDRLRAGLSVTAVIAPNDALASYAWLRLERAGIPVPGRVSVMGFDDLNPFASLLSGRRLATLRVPLARVGARAANKLLAVLREGAEPLMDEWIPTEWVPGDSAGPAPGQRP